MFFYKLKVCGNPTLTKFTGVIFPTAFARFLSLCHILVILTIFQTFSLLLHLLLLSVIFDVTVVIFLVLYFKIKVCIFLRHNAIAHLVDDSKYHFYMHWETKKTHVTHFITIFTSLQWSGTKRAISLRSACTPKG